MDSESVRGDAHLFQQIRDRLISLLRGAREICDDGELDERITAARQRLTHERLNIMVVGEFSRGKSTFLNTLLGKPVLPSKVNPTTATINLIESGDQARMTLRYRSGEEEQVELPEVGINKFLDAYVTTANERAQAIETIRITVPGRLAQWQCVLVDTPGVNDLDDMREEITFRFLSRADACIVVLDGQQPLSESERRFLRDRVLGRDISRLFFVVNRMDEIPQPGSDPSPEQNERIRRYVKSRLQENLEKLGDVQIHTIASKPVLRSRVKGESSAWNEVFERMEEGLLRFVGENASRNRIPDHLDRAGQIIQDVRIVLVNQLGVIGITDRELQIRLVELRRQRELALSGMEGVRAVVLDEKHTLVRTLRRALDERLASLKTTLLEQARSVSDDGDLLLIKSTLSRALRDLVTELEDHVQDWREELHDRLRREFSNVFEPKALSATGSFQFAQYGSAGEDLELSRFSDSDTSERSIKDYVASYGASLGTGAVVGMVGTILLGGPVAIAAAAIGGGLIGQQVSKQRMKKELERIRSETQKAITRQLDDFLASSAERAKELAETASDQVSGEIDDMLTVRRSMLETFMRTQQEEIQHQADDAEMRRTGLQDRMNRCGSLLKELILLQEEIQ